MDLIFLWLATLLLGYWIFRKINEWKSLPPGPWGLPIIGYLPFVDPKNPHLTFMDLSKKYGPIYGLSMGSMYTVVLSENKLIRDVLSKDVFTGRANLFFGLMQGKGIICSEGPLWKDQRKLITAWLKTFGMSKHSASRDRLERRIAVGVSELVSNVKKNIDDPIDLSPAITHTLGNVINDILFGFKFPETDKTWLWLRDIQEEACHEMGVAGVVNFLPFVKYVIPSIKKSMDIILKGHRQTHRLYASIIARRRKMLGLTVPEKAKYENHADIFKQHPQGFIKYHKYSKYTASYDDNYFDPDVLIDSGEECILDKYLLEQKNRFDNEDPVAEFSSDHQLLYILTDLFGAGLDTTAVTLCWFLLYMTLYPDEQERVRTEILEVYPEEVEVEISKLPYLAAAICEAQRIRSIIPVGIPHGSMQNTHIGDYRIPKGTMIIPLQWAVHMDPNIWKDPECYKPSRFIDDSGNLLKPQEFIPFQTGKRMCPGDELARMLISNYVVKILRSFRLHLAGDPPSSEEMQGKVGVTLAPPKVLYRCEALPT